MNHKDINLTDTVEHTFRLLIVASSAPPYVGLQTWWNCTDRHGSCFSNKSSLSLFSLAWTSRYIFFLQCKIYMFEQNHLLNTLPCPPFLLLTGQSMQSLCLSSFSSHSHCPEISSSSSIVSTSSLSQAKLTSKLLFYGNVCDFETGYQSSYKQIMIIHQTEKYFFPLNDGAVLWWLKIINTLGKSAI